MRLFCLHVLDRWPRLSLAATRPDLSLDGTNNATERAIGKSKMRYKTMRGYKSLDGLRNSIALTQWLYSGETAHDRGHVIAA